MDTNSIIGLLGAFGFGSIATSGVTYWLTNKKEKDNRRFEEKKEAYIGFLDALHRSEIERTDEAALYVGHWETRIKLVGSHEAIKWCERMKETNPIDGKVHPDRRHVLKQLDNAMRRDLGIDV